MSETAAAKPDKGVLVEDFISKMCKDDLEQIVELVGLHRFKGYDDFVRKITDHATIDIGLARKKYDAASKPITDLLKAVPNAKPTRKMYEDQMAAMDDISTKHLAPIKRTLTDFLAVLDQEFASTKAELDGKLFGQDAEEYNKKLQGTHFNIFKGDTKMSMTVQQKVNEVYAVNYTANKRSGMKEGVAEEEAKARAMIYLNAYGTKEYINAADQMTAIIKNAASEHIREIEEGHKRGG